ncbi:hypothetical protein Mapa_012639 [Marchantia paleacea]|nr:hypothetical protein Mapa_012639 [Marchantia paleacea]
MVAVSGAARIFALCAVCAVTLSLLAAGPASAQLVPEYYVQSCPTLVETVTKHVDAAIKKEARMAASLLRLQFHDCFVQGCDASILLDDDSRLPLGEKTANPNINSVRGYEVIDVIKAELEKICPRTVSCADIITLASSISIQKTGGPQMYFPLGRKDSVTASFSKALEFLPGANLTAALLKVAFAKVGLDVKDLVTLSGGHTLGFSRCLLFTDRLYNFNGTGKADPTLEPSFLASLKQTCPSGGNSAVLKQLDTTVSKFDNQYYKELIAFKGLLTTDEVLFTQASDTKALVQTYAKDQARFFADFSASMIKMSLMKATTNTEVRINCRKPNSLLLQDMEPLIELRSDI